MSLVNENVTWRSEWNLGPIVSALCAQRAPASPRREHPLPSRAALSEIVSGLCSAMFPLHFGPPDVTVRDESLDYFVGDALNAAVLALGAQIERALASGEDDIEGRSADVIRQFVARLTSLRDVLETDIRAACKAEADVMEAAVVHCPGITAIVHHRIAHELNLLGVPLLPRIIAELAHERTGIDIHPGALIGEGFFIQHGTGVVIGETSLIGSRVRLHQGVTLGAKSFATRNSADVTRHPVVEDDVVIYGGATIVGRITIGRGSTIGGNVWLTHSVPPNSRITQAEVRTEGFDDGAGI